MLAAVLSWSPGGQLSSFCTLYLGQTQGQLRSRMKPFPVLLGHQDLLWRKKGDHKELWCVLDFTPK